MSGIVFRSDHSMCLYYFPFGLFIVAHLFIKLNVLNFMKFDVYIFRNIVE